MLPNHLGYVKSRPGGDGGGGGHGNGHSNGCHGCCGHDHSHDVREEERGVLYSLYLKVNTENVQCLNEAVDGSAKTIFKPWHDRLDKEKFVESDVDQELLITIPFTGTVKLKGIIVIGGEEDSSPSVMKLFKNRRNMTFDDAQVTPDQEFEMQPDREGMLEYNTNVARFNSVSCLSIYFPKNFSHSDDCPTKVYYIGLKGDFMEAERQEVIITNYEIRPNMADHKHKLTDDVSREVI